MVEVERIIQFRSLKSIFWFDQREQIIYKAGSDSVVYISVKYPNAHS